MILCSLQIVYKSLFKQESFLSTALYVVLKISVFSIKTAQLYV